MKAQERHARTLQLIHRAKVQARREGNTKRVDELDRMQAEAIRKGPKYCK